MKFQEVERRYRERKRDIRRRLARITRISIAMAAAAISALYARWMFLWSESVGWEASEKTQADTALRVLCACLTVACVACIARAYATRKELDAAAMDYIDDVFEAMDAPERDSSQS